MPLLHNLMFVSIHRRMGTRRGSKVHILYHKEPISHPIALRTDCGKYQCCEWRINFTYDYIVLLFGVSVFSGLIAGAM